MAAHVIECAAMPEAKLKHMAWCARKLPEKPIKAGMLCLQPEKGEFKAGQ